MPSAKTPHQRQAVLASLVLLALSSVAALAFLWPKGPQAKGLALAASTEGSSLSSAVTPALLSQGQETQRQKLDSGHGDGSAKTPAPLRDVIIRVKTYDGHAPVPDAEVWTVPSHATRLVTGTDGSVRFQTTDEELLAGVESAPGCLLWDPKSEPEGVPDRPGSMLTGDAAIALDGVTEIDLFVRRGGTIRGTLVDAQGTPLPGRLFYMAGANGNEWHPGLPHHTDDNGRFQLEGLRPNWYIIGPDPDGLDVFPYEQILTDWATTHEVVLKLLPAITVGLDVVPEGVGPSNSWAFPLTYRVVRNDRMSTVPNQKRRPAPKWQERKTLCDSSTRGTVHLELDLLEGPYQLEVRAKGSLQENGEVVPWLAGGWQREYPFVVTAKGGVEFGGADPPDLCVIYGMDRISRINATVAGTNGRIFATLRDTAGGGYFFHYDSRTAEKGSRSFKLALDFDRVSSKTVRFYESVPGVGANDLAIVEPTLETQEVTLECTFEQ